MRSELYATMSWSRTDESCMDWVALAKRWLGFESFDMPGRNCTVASSALELGLRPATFDADKGLEHEERHVTK